MPDTCRLCLRQSDLRDSHIIPKFIGKWLKSTGAVGTLLRAEGSKDTRRVQDLTTEKFLCGDCETRISKLETYFSQRVFYPFKKNDQLISVPQDERIAKFVVSVSLRVLWSLWNIEDEAAVRRRVELERLERNWRSCLLDCSGFIKAPETHHLICPSLWQLGELLSHSPFNEEKRSRMIWSYRRTTAYCLYEVFDKAYISSHMAGMHIISMIDPAELPVSRGTKVYPEQTLGKEPLGIGWGGYFQNLSDLADHCDKVMSNLSDAQRGLSESAVANNPSRAAASEDYYILIPSGSALRV